MDCRQHWRARMRSEAVSFRGAFWVLVQRLSLQAALTPMTGFPG